MHGQPLTCWQRRQRGVPGDGSEDSVLLWSARVLCQPSAPRAGPKATLSPKQAHTFLESNTCCILAWRKLHFTSINTISTLFPSLQSTARSFKMKDATEIPTCHIFIILATSISRPKAGDLVSLLLLLLSFLRLF